MTSSARTRVLDFLDEWPSSFGPALAKVHTDDGIIELNVADLYVLCDAMKGDGPEPEEVPAEMDPMNPEEQYAIEVPQVTLSGLTSDLYQHPISTANGRNFLTGQMKLGFREALLWRVSERDPWQVIMTGPLGVDG